MRALFCLLIALSSLAARSEALPPCARAVRYAADWFASPEIDTSKSTAQVSSMGSAAKGKGLQLGHVVVQTKLSVEPQASCAGVVVRLEFVKPVLRVASEFPPDSCAYARVMNHEITHVRIWRDIAARFREIDYPWPGGAKSADILTHAKSELATLTRAQDEFDSPEEYDKNRTVCGGEIGRLVKLPGSPAAVKPLAAAKRG